MNTTSKDTKKVGKWSLYALILASMFFAACGGEEEAELTDAEEERRQDLTFDLSGQYYADNAGQHPSVLNIENENKFHDIRATFSLGREFSDVEREKLSMSLKSAEQRMTDQEADMIIYNLRNKLQALALGVGKTFEVRGGENVVLDATGAQSEAVLTSRKENFYEVTFSGSRESYAVELFNYFTAQQSDMTLSWNVTRNTDKYGQNADKRKGIFITIHRTVYDAFNQPQQTSEVCNLELVSGSFKK